MAIQRNRRKWFKKLLYFAVIAVCASAILSMTSADVFFRCFFGRSELRAQTLELRYADIDQNAYPRRAVSFLSGKNRLRGYFYGSGEQGVILIVHGMNGGADSHLPEILYFADHGWRVFAFDGTGVRDSEGSGTVGLSQLRADTLAALEYLSQSEYGALPVVLYGHSAGGYAAAAALESGYNVRAAVCISAFNSPVDTMCYNAGRYVGDVLAYSQYPFLWLENLLVSGSDGNDTAVDAINATDTPALIVSGTEDEVVPERISVAGCRDRITNLNVTYLTISEGSRSEHSTAWFSEEAAEYRDEVVSELDALEARYGDDIPDGVLQTFWSAVDQELLYETDEDFMNTVNAFCLDAIRSVPASRYD